MYYIIIISYIPITLLLFTIYFEIRFLILNLLIDTNIRHIIYLYATIITFNVFKKM